MSNQNKNKHIVCIRILQMACIAFLALSLTACGSLEDDPELNVTFDETTGALTAKCKTGTMGGKTSCKTESAWESYAEQICEERGARLEKFGVDVPCGIDVKPAKVSAKDEPLKVKKGYRIAKFMCCKKPQTSPKPAPVKPEIVEPAPAYKCYTDTVGSPKQCFDGAHLKTWASKECNANGGKITQMSAGEECKGGFHAVKFECCAAPQVSEPVEPSPEDQPVVEEPAAKCYTDFLGDEEKVCLQPSEYKLWAKKVCGNNGGNVTQLSLGNKCGKGGHSLAKYECCAIPQEDLEPTPEIIDETINSDEEEPAQKCFTDIVGSKKQCLSPAQLKAMAYKTCAIAGAELDQASMGQACKGGFHAVKVRCCKTAVDLSDSAASDDSKPQKPTTDDSKPQKPTPMNDDEYSDASEAQCITGHYGGGKMCIDNAELKAIAYKMCAVKGLELDNASLGASCGKNASNGVKVSCCEPEEETVVEEAPQCYGQQAGSVHTCMSASEWKLSAAKKCDAKGLTLSDMGLGGQCGKGEFSFAKFICCEN